jgi:hypothetical protein
MLVGKPDHNLSILCRLDIREQVELVLQVVAKVEEQYMQSQMVLFQHQDMEMFFHHQ